MTHLYAVRFADGTYMQGRKPQQDEGGFLVWTDPAHAGNAVVARKEAGKMAEDQDYEVVQVATATVPLQWVIADERSP